MSTEFLDKARQIDFDRLNALVSERIAALKLYITNIDKAEGDKALLHDAICRDLVLPCVFTLANFIEVVNVNVLEEESNEG